MKGSFIDMALFWGMDLLSTLGDKPYTKVSRILFVLMLAASLLHPLFRLIFLIGLPIVLSFKYKIKGNSWPWYLLAVVPFAVYLTSTQFVNFFYLVGDGFLLFLIVTTAGVFFNKKIVPGIVQALTDAQEETEEQEE